MSISKSIYLHRSEHYIYYYRRAIPEHLRNQFDGLREIKKSLKTRDKSVAIIRYGILASRIELKFRQLMRAHEMKNDSNPFQGIDPKLLIGLKRDAIASCLHGEDWALASGIVFALRGQFLNVPEMELESMSPVPVEVKGDRLYRIDGSKIDNVQTIPMALALADSAGIPKLIDEGPFFAEGIYGCKFRWGEEGDLSEELATLTGTSNSSDAMEIEPTSLPSIVEAPAPKKAEKPRKKTITFSRLMNEYLIYRSDLKEKSKEASRKIYEVFLDLNGDIDVSSIDHPLVMAFIETVQHKIPANAKKLFPHQTYKEISRMNHQKAERAMMSVENVNKYLSRLSTMFTYAVNRGYMDKNYAEKKRLKTSVHKKDKRRPFTKAEIIQMFTQIEPWASNNRTRPENFWINLIGAYSGARLGEICQLRTSDIYEANEGNISMWVMDINDEGEAMSTKTRNSIRRVPVHSKLIELGFLDYVKKRGQGGYAQLWDLTPNKDGVWSDKMSKRYAYRFKKAGITEPFHSWRHTVCDMLMKDPDVRKEEQEGLVGHAIEGESMGRYGKGLSLVQLKNTVEKISYDALDLNHMMSS